jgi:hypothetical protein
MINVQNLRRWIAALRSRKYKQIRGELYGGNEKECCAFGVAGAELLGASNDNYRSSSTIEDVLGIDVYKDVVFLNDCKKLKFYQIARWLERKFKNELAKGKGVRRDIARGTKA